jgi:hypothetical protein
MREDEGCERGLTSESTLCCRKEVRLPFWWFWKIKGMAARLA